MPPHTTLQMHMPQFSRHKLGELEVHMPQFSSHKLGELEMDHRGEDVEAASTLQPVKVAYNKPETILRKMTDLEQSMLPFIHLAT